MTETLEQFFVRVSGKAEMLPYQRRYGSDPFRHTFILVPTGLGKTLTVIIPWLYGAVSGNSQTPTRLVLVLPRQNLTQQTYKIACELVTAAGLQADVDVIELMGGSDDNRLTVSPDRRTIIVCTQDMYFSRALNRGYARKPTRWPMDFAVLNQDCLLVFDEVQLMSDGLATSAQLAAFRERFGIFGSAPTVWMSATARAEWLDTVDFHSSLESVRVVGLNRDDLECDVVQKRFYASKTVAIAPESCRKPSGCAEFVLAQHRPGERTLIIANTVQRAREIFESLQHHPGAVLLHSRFRRADRDGWFERLDRMPSEGQIVVATQVVEAGVDITSQRLITDAAPWSSLVQRFGRVNRYGDDSDARIWWVDQPQSSKKVKKPEDLFAPYAAEACGRAIERLRPLRSAAPADLPDEDGDPPWQHVLRRSDLLDLFDTSPDLAGNHIDVSRFIRATEEKDCYLAWREWNDNPDALTHRDIRDEELCPVPIGDLREFVRGTRQLYTWNFSDEKWDRIDPGEEQIYPGMILVTHAHSGGYTPETGWNPKSGVRVPVVEASSLAIEGDSSDPLTWRSYRQSLIDHTELVRAEMRRLYDALERLGLANYRSDLETAAAKHDWGKAHDVMQRRLHNAESWTELLGKQEKEKAAGSYERRHFRHEFASALAMLTTRDSDLAVYLVAAHHGRIRLAVRSMPNEQNAGRVRGIADGDVLKACQPASGFSAPEVQLSLDVVRLGASEIDRGWSDRMIDVRDKVGVFRLAYLEMLLRTADALASGDRKEVAACMKSV